MHRRQFMTNGIRASPCHRRHLRETLGVIPVLAQWKPICFRWAYLFSSGNGSPSCCSVWGWHGRNNRELLDQEGWSLFIQWENKKEGRQALLFKDRACSWPKGRVCIQLDTPPWAGIHKVTPAALFSASLHLVPHRFVYLAAQVQALKEHMHTKRHAHTY